MIIVEYLYLLTMLNVFRVLTPTWIAWDSKQPWPRLKIGQYGGNYLCPSIKIFNVKWCLFIVPYLSFSIVFFNCVLPSVDSISDLGVIFSCDLSFNMQVDKLCSKARCRAAMILRSFQSRDCKLLFRAFTVYVRPILEYCSNVWSPYRLVDIRRIESVQRFFTKRLRGLKDMTYVERLECLNADSLECRRMKTDLGMYHKILHGLVDIEPDSFFQVWNGCTRSNGLSLTKSKINCNLERYSFRNRWVNVWNLLPQYVVCSNDVISFKRNLRSVDLISTVRKAAVTEGFNV